MQDVEAIAVFAEPVRRALYDYIAAAGREVGRAEAADAVGVQRTLAAFHLDKLAEAGLLEVDYVRLSGRTGPGAGRPAKVYRPAAEERLASVPPRDYRAAALLLAEAVEAAGAVDALNGAARRRGQAAAAEVRAAAKAQAELGNAASGPQDLAAVLTDHGYRPYTEDGVIRMRNCPFHALSEAFPGLVCDMNRAMLQALLDGIAGIAGIGGAGAAGPEVRFAPRPGECCTVLAAVRPAAKF